MQAGILIIGSLLWDERDPRPTWRSSRLKKDELILVKAPIYYGRRSSSRGNTFTMTFRDDSEFGQAVLIPCSSPAKSVSGLIAEAEFLWQAEQPSAQRGAIGANWGCVGILVRDCDDATLLDLAGQWSDHFQERITSSIPPVDEKGMLKIPWPVKVDDEMPADVDIILAVATEAEGKTSPRDVANAWIRQDEGHERYFFENVRHNIRTPEDLDIWRIIETYHPNWLGKREYKEVITQLRKEKEP